MKAIAKFAIPAALVAVAFGAQAQTIETDYPAVAADGSVVSVAPVAGEIANASPYLVQSNFEGPKADPAQIAPSTQDREAVRAGADVNVVRWNPADLS
ncbi:MAG TPA: hypothetical protein PK177_20495 [Burkholderiaceae bacterium]|nr:hypothetical protein [Burkholderiaceae bacterium]